MTTGSARMRSASRSRAASWPPSSERRTNVSGSLSWRGARPLPRAQASCAVCARRTAPPRRLARTLTRPHAMAHWASAAADSTRKSMYREFKKVVEEADVILEVLDARDPLGCRSKQIEEMILNSGGKKVILVLNKIGAPLRRGE